MSMLRSPSLRALAALAVLSSLPAAADEVTPPQAISRAEAALPADAPPPLQDHVLLEFTIGVDGRVSDVLVVESAGPGWDEAAVAAVKRWVFSPAVHRGAFVPSRTRLEFAIPIPAGDAGVPLESADAGTPAEALDGGGAERTPAAVAPVPDLADAGAAPPDGGADEDHAHALETTVTGRSLPKNRGVGDQRVELGALQAVPRRTPGELLKLAPGVLLVNEGGELHPEAIYLRGFEAGEGEDVELLVDGVPINDSGNIHGAGFADLHFLIPELVESVRVIEGPYDPRQGNYALAGSAEFELGNPFRGLFAKVGYGSYNSARVLATWRPPRASSRNFAGVQLLHTDGFGQNRQAQAASALAQWELDLSEATSVRVTLQGYGGRFKSAGLLREDDLDAGRVGFFDTYDPGQGGDSARFSASVALHGHEGPFTWQNQGYAVFRLASLRENFTGFLTDHQEPWQAPHGQRGDLLDRHTSMFVAGLKGYGRWQGRALGRTHELELGYSGRFDVVDGKQQRLAAATSAPYATEVDVAAQLGDVGLYADLNLHLLEWLTIRGGVRGQLFTYWVHDRCAVRETALPPPQDGSCFTVDADGQVRAPDSRTTAASIAVLPRATLVLGPWAGVTASFAYGEGVHSLDPTFVAEVGGAPVARGRSFEGGFAWSRQFEPLRAEARAAFFGTRLDQDLVFHAEHGKEELGGASTRLGALVSGRVTGDWLDLAAHLTWVRATFDATGEPVPYVPDLVARADAAVFHDLPLRLAGKPFRAQVAAGLTWVAPRALGGGERGDPIFTVDGSLELAWSAVSLGAQVTNLFDARYRQSQLYDVSNFDPQAAVDPDQVPEAKHFIAGPPRAVWVTLGVRLGD